MTRNIAIMAEVFRAMRAHSEYLTTGRLPDKRKRNIRMEFFTIARMGL